MGENYNTSPRKSQAKKSLSIDSPHSQSLHILKSLKDKKEIEVYNGRCQEGINSKGVIMFWVCDFTIHVKYPFLDYFTAKRWLHYVKDIKHHDCEMDIMTLE